MSEVYSFNLALFALIILLGIFGAFVGSFASKVIYRLEGGRMGVLSLFSPSICPACTKKLKAVDKIPVVGFLRLRGRSSCCGAEITRRYLYLEIAGIVLIYLTLYFQNFDLLAVIDYFFVMTLVCELYITYDGYKPPEALSFFIILLSILVGILHLSQTDEMITGLLAGFLTAYLFYTFFDKKSRRSCTLYFAAVSAFLGYRSSLIIITLFMLLSLGIKGTDRIFDFKFSRYSLILTVLVLIDFTFKIPIQNIAEAVITFIFN